MLQASKYASRQCAHHPSKDAARSRYTTEHSHVVSNIKESTMNILLSATQTFGIVHQKTKPSCLPAMMRYASLMPGYVLCVYTSQIRIHSPIGLYRQPWWYWRLWPICEKVSILSGYLFTSVNNYIKDLQRSTPVKFARYELLGA